MANHIFPAGEIKSGNATPTISSITTLLGSSPQYGSNLLAAHVPRIVNTMQKTIVPKVNWYKETFNEATNQTIVAANAPAVPGPHGQKPHPKPVPIITGNNGGRFIFFDLQI